MLLYDNTGPRSGTRLLARRIRDPFEYAAVLSGGRLGDALDVRLVFVLPGAGPLALDHYVRMIGLGEAAHRCPGPLGL